MKASHALALAALASVPLGLCLVIGSELGACRAQRRALAALDACRARATRLEAGLPQLEADVEDAQVRFALECLDLLPSLACGEPVNVPLSRARAAGLDVRRAVPQRPERLSFWTETPLDVTALGSLDAATEMFRSLGPRWGVRSMRLVARETGPLGPVPPTYELSCMLAWYEVHAEIPSWATERAFRLGRGR